jgi:hypothetical protein
VNAQPRPNGQAEPWNADAHLANGRYTLVIDIPDGVRCTVYFLPSQRLDMGCGDAGRFGGFQLRRRLRWRTRWHGVIPVYAPALLKPHRVNAPAIADSVWQY